MHAFLIAQHLDERAVLSLVLQRADLVVTTAVEVERAMKAWPEQPTDLILLAGSGDPVEQVRLIRAQSQAPLLLIVDSAEEDLQVRLLEAGADLVLPRPFGVRLLLAQVRALLRRSVVPADLGLPALTLSGLTLDPAARTVQLGDRPPQRLTHLEFRLLHTLMIHRSQILPTEMLVERVWGYSGGGDRKLVHGLISRLRAKAEPDPRQPRYIVTLPGIGYAFDPQGEIAR